MTDNIPIKGYATFDPLKHCVIGSGFTAEMFSDLPIYKNKKIMDPLKKMFDETEEDYQQLEKILKQAGVKTYRAKLDMDRFKTLKTIYRPPMTPRDHFAVIGEKFYAGTSGAAGYLNIIKQIDKKDIEVVKTNYAMSTANIVRVGKDIFWDRDHMHKYEQYDLDAYAKVQVNLESQGYRIHRSSRGWHSDGCFCVVKPGCIVSLNEIQNYQETFPGWDVLYLPDQSWDKLSGFNIIKEKVGGRWWLKGEEHNDELINFVNVWLNEWVGYVEETVFDVNMLSVDQNTIICNNYNKDVFAHFKKHKVEPIVFNFRHRFFWDGGIHCITQDLYREGTMEDYFG